MAGPAPLATTRRATLIGGVALCCLPHRASAATAVVEIAPGVFVRRGPDEEATPGNVDGIANVAFVLGSESVAVFDPGGSRADGLWLAEQLRLRTDRPVRHIILSHVHPDHVFGASAFPGAEIVGHAQLGAALAARGAYDRARLVAILGAEATGPLALPTRAIGPEGATLDLGGRRLVLTAHGIAHTDCDLTAFDPAASLLFTGDLLFVGRVPSLDGSVTGWLAEIDALEAMGAANAMPGHGPAIVPTAAAFVDLRRYLVALRDGTRQAIADGVPIDVAAETVAAEERDRWDLFDDYNGRNVTRAYKELEWE